MKSKAKFESVSVKQQVQALKPGAVKPGLTWRQPASPHLGAKQVHVARQVLP
jgi:hypothetical protein